MHTGSCLCHAVTFEVNGDLGTPGACHCQQCRKQSGHYWASTEVSRASLTITGEEKLTWFQASQKVRRGFCASCGSFLFWDPIDSETTEIAMGAFDSSTQLHLERHIFVAEKGDYYEIADGLPQKQR